MYNMVFCKGKRRKAREDRKGGWGYVNMCRKLHKVNDPFNTSLELHVVMCNTEP